MNSDHQIEKGSTVLWVMCLCCVCILSAVLIAKLGFAATSQTVVQNAADASALSAAFEISNSNYTQACQAAELAAVRNNSKLLECRFSIDHVVVRVALVSDANYVARSRAEIE